MLRLASRVSRSHTVFYIHTRTKVTTIHDLVKSLEGVTIVNDVKSAKHALAVLSKHADRVVAWDTETNEYAVAKSVNYEETWGRVRCLCMSGFAGDDLDFGNGPRLWVDNSGDSSEVVDMFRDYFADRRFVHSNSFHLMR
jgi:DNA polymerase-1